MPVEEPLKTIRRVFSSVVIMWRSLFVKQIFICGTRSTGSFYMFILDDWLKEL